MIRPHVADHLVHLRFTEQGSMDTPMYQLSYPGQGRRFGVSYATLLAVAILSASCTSATTDPVEAAVPASSSTTQTVPSTTSTSTTTATEIQEMFHVTAQLEGALLGISTGLSGAERAPRFRQIEEDVGRTLDIGHVFHSWDKPIPTVDDLMHIDEDRLLMISWNGTDTREIAAGDHDDWIRTQATAVRDLEKPLLLRWLWEMDGNRRRTWVHSGPDYVAAWLHIRDVFAEVGADNAQFVWCPNEFLFWEGGEPEIWYPGDDNVDWLCADGYNWGTSSDAEDWVALDDIFADFVAWAAPRNLPIMIGETGAGEAEPSAKAEWLRSIPDILRTSLPEVDALVYFDKDFTEFGHQDWRVDTSEDTYAAWIEISNDPWLNPFDR